MSKKVWGVVAPVMATVITCSIVAWVGPAVSIEKGIYVGMVLALAQSLLSVAAMKWAWNKKNVFYWVWGGGMFVRLIIFGTVFFIVNYYTQLHVVATMVSMVLATTIFLVFESSTIFG